MDLKKQLPASVVKMIEEIKEKRIVDYRKKKTTDTEIKVNIENRDVIVRFD